MTPQPPAKPSKNATRKALEAYHSELRRWARELEEQQQQLEEREEALNAAMEDMDSSFDDDGELMLEDEEECECGPEEAQAGCPCSTCVEWRKLQIECAMSQDNHKGDEVMFLENLYKLKDKRKSKDASHVS
jgi:hypothetical protein